MIALLWYQYRWILIKYWLIGQRTGSRMKCSGCRIVVHISCIPQMKFPCRATYWDGDLRQYRENTTTIHHWVHRRSQTGKCQNCSKVSSTTITSNLSNYFFLFCFYQHFIDPFWLITQFNHLSDNESINKYRWIRIKSLRLNFNVLFNCNNYLTFM